jgi:hypothetical protein
MPGREIENPIVIGRLRYGMGGGLRGGMRIRQRAAVPREGLG